MSLEDRFWGKVAKAGPDHCWEWLAAKLPNGYGGIQVNGAKVGAHRVSYELNIGEIPEGLCVLHACDNPGCVNPAHLWLGTNADNSADMVAKGRSARLKGEKHGNNKLTGDQVLEIRRLYPEHTMKELAAMFGVSGALVCRIVNRKIWKHL